MAGWTKRAYVNGAFEELGLGSYAFDLPPEQEQMALRRLDAMVAEWSARGIRLGWPISSSSDAIDPDQDPGTTDHARQAIITNLAIRLAGPFGKTIPAMVATTARQSLANLVRSSVVVPVMQFPADVPMGAGNRSESPFFPSPIQSGDINAATAYDDL